MVEEKVGDDDKKEGEEEDPEKKNLLKPNSKNGGTAEGYTWT